MQRAGSLLEDENGKPVSFTTFSPASFNTTFKIFSELCKVVAPSASVNDLQVCVVCHHHTVPDYPPCSQALP